MLPLARQSQVGASQPVTGVEVKITFVVFNWGARVKMAYIVMNALAKETNRVTD
jgi:hypothetical protein